MAFSSAVFLFCFLPVSLLVWFACGARARLPALLGLSLLFSFWGSGWLVFLLLGSIVFNYALGLAISRAVGRAEGGLRPGGGRWLLGLGILSNLVCLGYFKYLDFGIGALNAALAAARLPPLAAATAAATKTALPLGISFFTFKVVSYLIDVYRGQARAARNPLHLAAYIALFPQLTAGPIGRYTDLGPQLAAPRLPGAALFSRGAFRFVAGLAKKVLIADTLGAVADEVFRLDPARVGVGGAWLGAVSYTLQIYFDFSGYSDMAIGIGQMLGLRFAENFDYPYISRSIREFWRRWHISLSTWFRDYLYIPLGGGRARTSRVALNLVTVFALCGLWHGASWTFVAWGFYHGLFLAAERAGLGRALERVPRPVQHLYTLLVVTVGWVLFRAESLPAGLRYLNSLFVPCDGVPLVALGRYDSLVYKAVLAAAVVGSAPWLRQAAERLRCGAATGPHGRRPLLLVTCQVLSCAWLAFVFVLSAMHVASGSSTPFLYAQF